MARLGRSASWSGSGPITGTKRAAGCSTPPERRAAKAGLLPARAKPVQDTPTPSPTAWPASSAPGCTSSPATRAGASGGEALVAAFAGRRRELGLYAAAYLLALDWQLNPATHLVVVGRRRAIRRREACIGRPWPASLPRRVVRRLFPSPARRRSAPAASGDAGGRVECRGLRLYRARAAARRPSRPRRLAGDACVAPCRRGD